MSSGAGRGFRVLGAPAMDGQKGSWRRWLVITAAALAALGVIAGLVFWWMIDTGRLVYTMF